MPTKHISAVSPQRSSSSSVFDPLKLVFSLLPYLSHTPSFSLYLFLPLSLLISHLFSFFPFLCSLVSFIFYLLSTVSISFISTSFQLFPPFYPLFLSSFLSLCNLIPFSLFRINYPSFCNLSSKLKIYCRKFYNFSIFPTISLFLFLFYSSSVSSISLCFFCFFHSNPGREREKRTETMVSHLPVTVMLSLSLMEGESSSHVPTDSNL